MQIEIEIAKEDGTVSNRKVEHQGEPDEFMEKYQAQEHFDELFYSHLEGTKAIGRKYRADRSGTTEVHIVSFGI